MLHWNRWPDQQPVTTLGDATISLVTLHNFDWQLSPEVTQIGFRTRRHTGTRKYDQHGGLQLKVGNFSDYSWM